MQTYLKLKYLAREYWQDIVTYIIDIGLAYFAYINIDNLQVFLFTVIVLITSLIYIVYRKTKDKDFFFLPMDTYDSKKDWVGRGELNYLRGGSCYEISNSHSGFIFPKTLNWDDYYFSFDFKIINASLGWIVRAVNLSNYLMFQCFQDYVKPHIRINGEWIVFPPEKVNFMFDEKLQIDEWYKAIIICEKRDMRIKITSYKNKEVFFDRNWSIPEDRVQVIYSKDGNNELKLSQTIDFDFGAVGFRNHGHEKGYFKNVLVEKL